MTHSNTPDAYGLLDEGEVHYATPFRDEAEAVLRRTEDNDSVIVPLYRSPTLTDAERKAVQYFAALTVSPRQDDYSQAVVLRELLDRLGHQSSHD